MFIQGFLKTAAGNGLNPTIAGNISKGFNNSTGVSGLKQNWANLKNAFGGGAPPPAPKAAPANVSVAKPPMPPSG